MAGGEGAKKLKSKLLTQLPSSKITGTFAEKHQLGPENVQMSKG
jgi:hypothetical protein